MSGQELPEGWVEVPLGDVVEFKYGKSLPERARDGGEFPVFASSGHVGQHSQALSDGPTIVVGRKGSIGKVYLSPGPAWTIDTAYFIDDFGPFTPEFLSQWMGVSGMQDMDRASAIPGLNRNDAYGLPVSIPPISEQKRIVARLDALQARSRAAREALAEVPALLDLFRQSVLAAAFRGDLTAEWRAKNPDVEPASKLLERIRAERRRRWEEANPRKKYVEPEPVDDSELPELPEGWCWARFADLVDGVRSGTARTATKEATGYRVLRSSAIRPGSVDFDDFSFLPDAPGPEEVVARGDLLVTRLSGTLAYVGNGALVKVSPNPPVAYPDRIFRSRPLDQQVAVWLELSLGVSFLRRDLEKTAKSSAGHQRISQGDLMRFPVPLPPIEEQREALRVLPGALSATVVLRQVSAVAASELDTLDQSILARAFRGDLVDQDPNDEPADVLLARIKAEAAPRPARKARGRKPKKGAAP